MELFILMLVILNPFAQVLYLKNLIDELSLRDFATVHFKASVLSLGVYIVFVLIGMPLLNDVFQVRLAALEIFGGIIIMGIAYRYITAGSGSNLLFRGDIGELTPEISLPYMVGPGTIWVSLMIEQ